MQCSGQQRAPADARHAGLAAGPVRLLCRRGCGHAHPAAAARRYRPADWAAAVPGDPRCPAAAPSRAGGSSNSSWGSWQCSSRGCLWCVCARSCPQPGICGLPAVASGGGAAEDHRRGGPLTTAVPPGGTCLPGTRSSCLSGSVSGPAGSASQWDGTLGSSAAQAAVTARSCCPADRPATVCAVQRPSSSSPAVQPHSTQPIAGPQPAAVCGKRASVSQCGSGSSGAAQPTLRLSGKLSNAQPQGVTRLYPAATTHVCAPPSTSGTWQPWGPRGGCRPPAAAGGGIAEVSGVCVAAELQQGRGLKPCDGEL